MVYERVPTQAEIYRSYLVATVKERKDGIFLSKIERRKRFRGGRKKHRRMDESDFRLYYQRILEALRIKLISSA